MKNNELYKYLELFLTKHLPKERGYSGHTTESYYTGIKQFLIYCSNKYKIKTIELTLQHFSFENVADFLNYVEDELKNSTTTRNQRMAAIQSFVKYVAQMEPKYIHTVNSLDKIRTKKSENKKLDYLTIEEYKDFIGTVNLSTIIGLRHYTLINLLYDTATRVSEIVNMKIEDFHFGNENSVKILGKGNKYRQVYINKHTVNLVQKYIDRFDIKSGYLFKNSSKQKLSRFGVGYVINKYYKLACEKNEVLKSKNVTPHTMRHTKACHFLMNGTSLPVIQRFLGHSSLKTTETYLDITSDVVLDAVEKVGDLVFDKSKENEKVWIKDTEILSKINALFKDE